MTNLLSLKGVRATKTGLVIQPRLPLADWKTLGGQLRLAEGAIQWWIGDWLNYGEKTYGEKYTEALENTDYGYQSLRNMKYVAASIELSRRKDNLSWYHHAEVAALPPAEQDRLLAWAEKVKASVREVRTRTRNAKPKEIETPEHLRIIQELQEWLRTNCPGVHAYIQTSVYDLTERSKHEDAEVFDLELRSITCDQVKAACKPLVQGKQNAL